ncbi:MAG: hypothetical protein QOD92_1047 [Acidimicrobiaceae bacterium]|jgi:hypothetical protein
MTTDTRTSRVRRILVGTVAVAVLTLGLNAPPADAAEKSLNFTGYCRAAYSLPGVGVTAWHKWTGSWTAVTWRCRQTAPWQIAQNFASIFRPIRIPVSTRDYQIDVDAACRWQYGKASYSKLKGQGWGDWRCVA